MKAVVEDVKAAVQSVEVQKKSIADLNLDEAGQGWVFQYGSIWNLHRFLCVRGMCL